MSAPPVPWTTAIRREALALYADGRSLQVVAAELVARHGVAPQPGTIGQWARAAGINRGKTRAHQLSYIRRRGQDLDALRATARQISEDRLWSPRMIAAHLGVSRSFVLAAIEDECRDDHSTATRKRVWAADLPDVRRRIARRERAIRMRVAGAPISAIVEAIGRQRVTVWRYLHEAGLTRRARQ